MKTGVVQRAVSKIEGAAANLRGPLFELIVGHCVHEQLGGSIDIGREIDDPESGERAEIDVLLVKSTIEVRAYECKGDGLGVIVDADEVEDWLTHKVPRIKNYLRAQERFRNSRLAFEFGRRASSMLRHSPC